MFTFSSEGNRPTGRMGLSLSRRWRKMRGVLEVRAVPPRPLAYRGAITLQPATATAAEIGTSLVVVLTGGTSHRFALPAWTSYTWPARASVMTTTGKVGKTE
jgi:hypothetical protein